MGGEHVVKGEEGSAFHREKKGIVQHLNLKDSLMGTGYYDHAKAVKNRLRVDRLFCTNIE